MRSMFTAAVLAAFLLTGLVRQSPAAALAASQPTASLNPSHVPIGGAARLKGAHLRPNTYYELLLSVPNGSKAIKLLFGVVKSNANGGLSSVIHIPVVTRCGAATINMYPIRQSGGLRVRLTLTRCTASKKVPPPPKPIPTPKGSSKKKTPPPPP